MEFNINEKVVIKKTNEVGIVIDKAFFGSMHSFVYNIKRNDGKVYIYFEKDLEPCKKATEYKIETDIADNVVIGIIYEVIDGQKVEVCRGHGHIIHEGVDGIAQACAYAYKKALEMVDTGIYYKRGQK